MWDRYTVGCDKFVENLYNTLAQFSSVEWQVSEACISLSRSRIYDGALKIDTIVLLID